MKTSDKGLLALIRREALVLSTYKDSVGVLTIGVGHTAAAGPPKPVKGLTITAAEGMALFRKDVAKYERDVNAAVKVELQQYEFDALVSFHYNTGAIKRATLTKLLNALNRLSAAKAFMSWVKPPEITGRRNEERKQFLTGNYGDVSRVPIYAKWPGRAKFVSADEILLNGSSAPMVVKLDSTVPQFFISGPAPPELEERPITTITEGDSMKSAALPQENPMFNFIKDPHKAEMAKMLLRQAMQLASGALIATGFIKATTAAAVLVQYEAIAGLILTTVTGVWMIYRNTKSAMTTNVVAFPEVKGIITERTAAGVALADSVPSAAVVSVSTTAAREIAA